MKRKLSLVFIILVSISGAFLPACTGLQRGMVVEAAKAACVLISTQVSDKTVKEVCATAEELAPFVKQILSARARASASVSASASASSAPSASASSSK